MTGVNPQSPIQSTTELGNGVEAWRKYVEKEDSTSEVTRLRASILVLQETIRHMERLISELRACQCG